MSAPVTQTIFCVECDRESKGKATGWRAYLLHDLHELDTQLVEEVAIFCPSCAARAFSDDGG